MSEQIQLSLKKSHLQIGALMIAAFLIGYLVNGPTTVTPTGGDSAPAESAGDVVALDSPPLSVVSLKQYASDIGLNTEEFNSCLDNGDYTSEVQGDLQEGQAVGISGTPGFFVNGQKIVGAQPYSVFEAAIEAALNGTEGNSDLSGIELEHILGDPDAPVTIIEFSDFECPFCGRFYSQTLPSIKENYVDTGKVKMVFKDFPLGFHQYAKKAAEAAECAGEQDKYWEMHDKIFESS